jgi:hypothetical protein
MGDAVIYFNLPNVKEDLAVSVYPSVKAGNT